MIRPIDLQNAILQSIQNAPAVQRAEEGPWLAAQAAQAAFAAEITKRDESVAAIPKVVNGRIGAKSDKERDRERGSSRKRTPLESLEDVIVDDGGSVGEPPHLIDFSA